MLNFLYTYAYWHYTEGVKTLIQHARNFLLFLWHFFAIPTLLVTLFASWRRMQESYQDGFDIKEKFSAFLVNTIMRGVGAFVRLVMIIFGIFSILLFIVIFNVTFLIWILLPAVIGMLIVLFFDTLL